MANHNTYKIFVIRYQTDPQLNHAAMNALVPFYNPAQAKVVVVPLGVISVFMSDSTADEIFAALINANIGNHFTVIQSDEADRPIKTYNSMMTSFTPSQEAIDSTKSDADFERELNALLDKVQEGGRESLSEKELHRLEELSAR